MVLGGNSIPHAVDRFRGSAPFNAVFDMGQFNTSREMKLVGLALVAGPRLGCSLSGTHFRGVSPLPGGCGGFTDKRAAGWRVDALQATKRKELFQLPGTATFLDKC